MKWQKILPTVWMFRDSCNVYAVQGPGGIVIIDAGTGEWVSHLDELPSRPVALLCTHYFRDHAAGALPASRAGIPVYVPEGERDVFVDPVHHHNSRSTYIIYDNHWVHFAPIQSVPVAGVLRDYDRPKFGGLEFEVIPLPGVTLTQIGLGVTLPGAGANNRPGRVIFAAEAIHSPGRIARLAPLQYNYSDFTGIINTHTSARWLRERKPDVLLPSLGNPMLSHTDEALSQLQDHLRYTGSVRPELAPLFDKLGEDPLERVTDHVWKTTHSFAFNWFIISDSGKAMVIDYGYDFHNIAYPNFSKPANRRAVLHSMHALKKRFGIETIDMCLVSHFHDDHVSGIPLIQRMFNTKVWAAENFADLLEFPEAHCFPCNWPQPTRIDRRLKLDEPFQWEEYTFHLHPMNGHTRFSALIGFEADGKRFAHTGDQYFFHTGWGNDPLPPFEKNERKQQHVYRNGALLNGYDLSDRWMLDWRPDIVLQGHQPTYFTDAAFFKHIEAWSAEYKDSHTKTMVLGEQEPHFNLDSWGGWIWPYRTHLSAQATPTEMAGASSKFVVTVTVRNPLPTAAKLEVRLVGPDGWVGETKVLDAAPRAEATCELSMLAIGACRRQPIAAELRVDGQPYGQVAEALVTIGGTEF